MIPLLWGGQTYKGRLAFFHVSPFSCSTASLASCLCALSPIPSASMASQTSALDSTASFELKSVSERALDTDGVSTRPTLSRAPSYDDDAARVINAPDGGLRAWLVLCGAFVLTFFYGGYTYSFGIFQAAFEKRDLASTPILVILGSIPVFFLAITAIRAHMLCSPRVLVQAEWRAAISRKHLCAMAGKPTGCYAWWLPGRPFSASSGFLHRLSRRSLSSLRSSPRRWFGLGLPQYSTPPQPVLREASWPGDRHLLLRRGTRWRLLLHRQSGADLRIRPQMGLSCQRPDRHRHLSA